MSSKIFRWIKDLPNTVKLLIGLISTVIPFVILLRTNFELGVVVLSAIIIVAVLSSLAYVTIATNTPVAGFSPAGAGGYKYPHHRRWAVAGICLIVIACVLLFILKPTRHYILAALKGTGVAPHADVLIAQFDARLASKKFEIPNRIKANLEGELRKYNLKEMKVETLPAPITSAQEAKAAAEQAGSKVVVWGWYDDLGITINLYTPKPASSGDEVLKMKEVAWSQGTDASADISFKIRERLPANITFLSLFIIGNLTYQNNEYQKGHRMFDAAMSNLPKEIELENQSLLHFFAARSLEARGDQDGERIICEYSKAIELNPNFAAAYNNLGILITKPSIASKLELYEKNEKCLGKIGYDEYQVQNYSDIVQDLFDKALSSQPDSAVIQYNKLAARWKIDSHSPMNEVEIPSAL